MARIARLSVLCCLLGACSLVTDSDGGETGLVARVWSFPAWSADGRTIYFSDRNGGGVTDITVKAVDVLTSRVRTLGTVRGLNHAEQLRSTEEPTTVYASIAHADWSLQLTIYRVPTLGGVLQPVATNVGLPWFVASSTGNRLAYSGSRYDSDTLFVADPAQPAGANAVAIPATGTRPHPMGLSPDGGALVYGSSSGVYLVPSAGGQHRLVWRPNAGDTTALAPQVTWRGDTPHLLVALDTLLNGAATIQVYDHDGMTGERTNISTIPRPLPEAKYTQLAWSGDGSAFALWVPVEVVQRNIERTTYRYRLYVQRAGASAQEKFELTSDQPLTWLEFSPDGRRIALLLSGALRVLPVDSD